VHCADSVVSILPHLWALLMVFAVSANDKQYWRTMCSMFAYAGVPHIVRPDGVYDANTRFSMYRWHITDPIRFEEDLKVTIQALGWQRGGRFLPLQDDIASVAPVTTKKSLMSLL